MDQTISQVKGASQPVTFAAPTTTGGSGTPQVTCTPASGDSFPIGNTRVTCTAKDSASQTAMCTFNVTLKGFSIPVTKYETFGDSLTEGENGLPQGSAFAPLFLDTPNAYPTKLQADFDAAYPGQGIVVINRGHSGDYIATTVDDIRRYVPADAPGAVLILSGYNDLRSGGCEFGNHSPALCTQSEQAVALGVRDCIRKAKESSNGSVKYIFVSNLTPPGPYLGGVNDRRIDPAAIVQTNGMIANTVALEGGVVLVDTYSTFVGHEADYTENDGLHLRPAGYQALADAFFNAINNTIPLTALAHGILPGPAH